jgi:hypothetical protein
MSAPLADYLLGEDFDLSGSIKQEAPPYLPDPLPPAYNLKPVSHSCPLSLSPLPPLNLIANFSCSPCRVGAVRQRSIASTLSEPARTTRVSTLTHHRPLSEWNADIPSSAGSRGFALAESIWSQDSDLTLDDLALESDTASGRSRSSASSRWSATPLTPSTSPHLQLSPTRDPAAPIPVHPPATPPATEPVPETPDSPAPAYSRDPLEFDPALLASLDPQLRSRPFEAFEDACWACFPDSPPATSPHTFRSPNPSVSRLHPSTARASFSVHTSFSNSSMATLAPPLPPLPPLPPPPPAYPTSKPLPNLPPPSPRSSAGHTQPDLPPQPQVVMSFESFVTLEDPPFPTAPPGETVRFYPLRAPVRPRSKSVGGTKRRIAGAISRLRGRE